jgi:hypothetical protein
MIRDMVKYDPITMPVASSIIPITLCFPNIPTRRVLEGSNSLDTPAFLGYKASISRWLPNQDERLLFK